VEETHSSDQIILDKEKERKRVRTNTINSNVIVRRTSKEAGEVPWENKVVQVKVLRQEKEGHMMETNLVLEHGTKNMTNNAKKIAGKEGTEVDDTGKEDKTSMVKVMVGKFANMKKEGDMISKVW
jgi:hypothetical protein